MLSTVERAALGATRVRSVVGPVGLMGLGTMTLADGLMRWIANQPIEGVRDLGGLAIAVAIACCIPVVMIERGNITIRLAGSLSAGFGRVLDALAAVLVDVVLGGMAWQVWLYPATMARAPETTSLLPIPGAPV